MKKGFYSFFRIFILMILATIIYFGQDAFSKIITNVPPDISSYELRAVVVEDFETTGEWQVQSVPKQFKATTEKAKKKNPVPVLEYKFIDGAPSDLAVEKWSHNNKGLKKTKCLGVHYRFKYPGHNSVHVIPPKPIRLPGRSQGISMWVHGRGKNYFLEAWVKDYKGNVHILKFGSVNFVGWKPVRVDIPSFIPQIIESYPQTKTLVIERFVLRSDPTEDTEDVFFFFDQLKVLTETFEVNFDGMELDKAFKKGGSSGGGTSTDASRDTK
jgi:hypothetical protein